MKSFESICNKELVNIKMQKNKDGKIEEIIDLTPFYESIAIDISEKSREVTKENIFNAFENEFGRPLSSMEYELINNWINKGISEELIREALKEAIFNGTLTLRYIDAILGEWTKNGFKTAEDVNVYLKKRKTTRKQNDELFDYNWLDDEE